MTTLSFTRTVAVPPKVAYEAWVDPLRRRVGVVRDERTPHPASEGSDRHGLSRQDGR